jgi:type IVB pilus formation R64 PilN family outer membrane protein
MKAKYAIFIALAVAALSGCAAGNRIDKAEATSQMNYGEIRKKVEDLQKTPSKPADTDVVYHTDPIVTLIPIRIKLDHSQEDSWCHFKKLATAEPITIMEFAQTITRYCHIPVNFSQDALSFLMGGISQQYGQGGMVGQQTMGMQPAGAMGSPMMPGGAPGATGMGMGQQGQYGQNAFGNTGLGGRNNLIDINYSGDVEGLFDVVTARLGLSWKKQDDHSFLIYNVDADSFYLDSIALENSLTADSNTGLNTSNTAAGGAVSGVSTGGSSVGSTTGSMQTAKVSIKTSIWSDIQKTLNVLKSPRGACNVSPSTGSITCVDTGYALHKIGSYISTENKNLTKQILFNVRILSVTMKDNDSDGFSWNAVWQSMSSKHGIKLVNNFTGTTGGMTGTFSVLQNTNSPFAGTDAVLSALSEFGTVRIIKEPSVATMNLQMVPVQVGDVNSYVPGSTVSTTANVGSQTSIQIATVTTGFSMTLFPYVMPDTDNEMLLHFAVSLTSYNGVRTITQGNAYAEAPLIGIPINSVQQIRLKPGQTLMLTGFDQDDSNSTKQGAFSPNNMLLGGSRNATTTRSTLAVLITPVILD